MSQRIIFYQIPEQNKYKLPFLTHNTERFMKSVATRIIQPEKYPQKIFYLEYLLALQANLGIVLTLSTINTFLLFTITLALKYKIQGFRVNFPILFVLGFVSAVGFSAVTLLLSAISALSTYLLVVYHLPKSSSMIGCKTVTEDNLLFTLFYPTSAAKSFASTSLFNLDTGSRMFDVINKDPGKPSKLPSKYIHLSSGYYNKLKVKNIVPHGPCVEKQYQLIIISHQLGFNTSYSFVQEFVEAGYIVLLLDHKEAIRNIHHDPRSEINKEFRKEQLKDRYNSASKALDYILDDFKLSELVGNSSIDKNKVHMMGHSFGGSTTLYTALNDERITGCALCYDPCFYILQDSYTLLNTPITNNNKILILLAEDYYQKHYPFFQNEYRAQTFKNNCANARVLRMLGVNHANYSDLSLFSSGQFHRLNVVKNNKSRLYFEMTLALSHQTLMSYEKFGSEEELVRELVERNEKWRKEIETTFRSINVQRHERSHSK